MDVIVFLIILMTLVQTQGYLKDLGEVFNETNGIETILEGLGVYMEPKIKGGTTTNMIRFPYAVLFLNNKNICGGTILSSKIVLTAAHCLDTASNISKMRVYAGARYIFDKAADVHKVWNFIIHDRYGFPEKFSNDIALLIIYNTFQYKLNVKPALLITHGDWMKDNSSKGFQVAGWNMVGGDLIQRSQKSTILDLDEMKLKIVPKVQCEAISGSGIDHLFCLQGRASKCLVRDESGGSVLWNGYVVGVVSHSVDCDLDLGMHTNVFDYRKWIDERVKQFYEVFCKDNDNKDTIKININID